MRIHTFPAVLALLAIPVPAPAVAWIELDLGVTATINDMHFWDARNGIVVGGEGVILRTEDGGDTWSAPQTPLDSAHYFWSVSFADELHGVVVGEAGALFITEDGGHHWTEGESGVDLRLAGVCMVTSLVGTAVGFQGTILRTVDGGTTWSPQPSEVLHSLSGVAFTGEDHGIVVGNFTMLRTTDGGATWDPVPRPMQNAWLFDVEFTDGMRGRSVGDFATILRTEDGGVTWTLEHSTEDDAHAVFAVSMSDGSNATAVGWFEDRQNVLRTTDGGETWVPDPTGYDRHLRAVHHSPELLIVAGGKILRAESGSTPAKTMSWSSLRASYR